MGRLAGYSNGGSEKEYSGGRLYDPAMISERKKQYRKEAGMYWINRSKEIASRSIPKSSLSTKEQSLTQKAIGAIPKVAGGMIGEALSGLGSYAQRFGAMSPVEKLKEIYINKPVQAAKGLGTLAYSIPKYSARGLATTFLTGAELGGKLVPQEKGLYDVKPGEGAITSTAKTLLKDITGGKLDLGVRKGSFTDFLVGAEPIQSVQRQLGEVKTNIKEFGGTKLEQNVYAPALVFGGLVADLSVGGGSAKSIAKPLIGKMERELGEKLGKDLTKEITERVGREVSDEAFKLMTKEKKAKIMANIYGEYLGKAVSQSPSKMIETSPIKNTLGAIQKTMGRDLGADEIVRAENIIKDGGKPVDVINSLKQKIELKNTKSSEQLFKDLFPETNYVPKESPTVSVDTLNEVVSNAKKSDALDAKRTELLNRIRTSKSLEKEGIVKQLGRALNPIKHLEEDTKNILTNWANKNVVAKILADQEANKFSIKGREGLQTILDYQKGKQTAFTKDIREAFDTIFKEANDRGLEVKYRKNYLPQVYKESPEEVTASVAKYMTDKGTPQDVIDSYINGKELPEQYVKSLKLNPSFSKDRVFPDYETAIKYGLTPKYNNPAQLLANYRKELETTINNRDLLERLSVEGKIAPFEIAPSNWEFIRAPYFKEGYKAPKELATAINNLFGVNDSGFLQSLTSGMAGLSRKMQEAVLSAGVPNTAINFFSIGQVIKDMTAGNIISAPTAFVRSNFTKQSLKWFEKNSKYLEKMAKGGIDLGDYIGNYNKSSKLVSAWDNIASEKGIAKKIGAAWDKTFGEKTFNSLIPQLQVNNFKGVYDKAIKKGLPEDKAVELAGNVVKNFFGLSGVTGRSKLTNDSLSSVFFAPKFREGVINTLLKTGESVTTKMFDPAYSKNRKLFVGMVATYGMYNYLNKQLTGHYMWENAPGKELDLEIPVPKNMVGKLGFKEGDKIYLGFMPSFLSFARNMVGGATALAKGDTETAGQKFGGLFSMPIKLLSEVGSNKDYFGREIYGKYDPIDVKAKKIAEYAGVQNNHPYIAFVYNQLKNSDIEKKAAELRSQGKEEEALKLEKGITPLYESISKATEMPLKFSSEESEAKSRKYMGLDNALMEINKYTGEERTKKMQDYINSLPPEDREWAKNVFYFEKIPTTGVTFSSNKIEAIAQYEQLKNDPAALRRKELELKRKDPKLYTQFMEVKKVSEMNEEERKIYAMNTDERVEYVYNKYGKDYKKLRELKIKQAITDENIKEIRKRK